MYILLYKDPAKKEVIKEEYNWFEDVSRFVENRVGNEDFQLISITYIPGEV